MPLTCSAHHTQPCSHTTFLTVSQIPCALRKPLPFLCLKCGFLCLKCSVLQFTLSLLVYSCSCLLPVEIVHSLQAFPAGLGCFVFSQLLVHAPFGSPEAYCSEIVYTPIFLCFLRCVPSTVLSGVQFFFSE